MAGQKPAGVHGTEEGTVFMQESAISTEAEATKPVKELMERKTAMLRKTELRKSEYNNRWKDFLGINKNKGMNYIKVWKK